MENLKQNKKQTMLDKIDLKVMDILQKEGNAITLQEIANKVGEKPQKIAKSLLRLFLHNEKLLNEKLLQISL